MDKFVRGDDHDGCGAVVVINNNNLLSIYIVIPCVAI
jgi:hypothetical protein